MASRCDLPIVLVSLPAPSVQTARLHIGAPTALFRSAGPGGAAGARRTAQATAAVRGCRPAAGGVTQ